jgi:hypothetical protein
MVQSSKRSHARGTGDHPDSSAVSILEEVRSFRIFIHHTAIPPQEAAKASPQMGQE